MAREQGGSQAEGCTGVSWLDAARWKYGAPEHDWQVWSERVTREDWAWLLPDITVRVDRQGDEWRVTASRGWQYATVTMRAEPTDQQMTAVCWLVGVFDSSDVSTRSDDRKGEASDIPFQAPA